MNERLPLENYISLPCGMKVTLGFPAHSERQKVFISAIPIISRHGVIGSFLQASNI